MTATQQQGKGDQRVFFYYPAFNEQYARRILAGMVSADKTRIDVAEATCFPGTGPMVKTYRLISEGPTTLPKAIQLVDPGIKADAFTKKEGKKLAIERASGIKTLQNGKQIDIGQDLILTIEIPVSEELIGRLFVTKVEEYLESKGFPKKEPKVKKEAGGADHSDKEPGQPN